jgi:hypothetical protein
MHEPTLTNRRIIAVVAVATLMVVGGFVSIAAAASTPKGTEHFTVFAVNTDGPKLVAIMSGVIADYGSVVSNQKNTELTLHLTKGTFRLNVAKLDAKLVAETASEPLYSATCSDYFKVMGSVTIVADSGTGSYRQIAGTLESSITVNEDQGPPCNSSTPFRQIFVLDGVGIVSK